MHKQRSPFTGGSSFGAAPFNFNAQQFVDASNFGSTDGLNGMPFLSKTQQIPMKHIPKEVIRSFSHPRDNGDGDCGVDAISRAISARSGGSKTCGDFSPITRQALATVGGSVCNGSVGSGTSISSSFNGHFEGENSIFTSTAIKDMKQKTPSLNEEPIASNPNTTVGTLSNLLKAKDRCITETDTEPKVAYSDGTCWQRAYNYVKSTIEPENQERLEKIMERWNKYPIIGYMVLLMQLFNIAMAATGKMITTFGTTNKSRIQFWRYRFHMRSTVRNMLWRMANAKANDTVLFLIIVLVTPWLFLLGLFGFAVSFVFYIKAVLTETIHQMHMRLM
ncbi:uncharacterized protein Dwil_GK17116 [Drosophila willistoni]|uniref:Uncharacterized protein n=1 Tax=Drosophila willistoni TaxID=7260 RepID=B4MNE3_DROWI|nr:uncharacterized protein LOC6639131 [Drosophila willistoni]EDW72652.1 uncharacterized protein Dwil_GK17116 [Drosophila willistoni]